MYYDYHIHSNFSNDSKFSMEDMIKASINLGLKEICFTDHVDYDVIGEPYTPNYNKYFYNLASLKEIYSPYINIKNGIEFGLQSHITSIYEEDVTSNNFDFIICSIHSIGKIDLYNNSFFNNKTQYQAYEDYYNELFSVIKKYKDYSVIGHLDSVKRYGGYNSILDDTLFSELIRSILIQIIHDGKGIEINTSSFRYNLPDLTPSRYIIGLYKDLGGEIITTGSDAHSPSMISHNFSHIYSYLKDSGFRYVCTFDNMNPQFIKI